jgi:probable O-glycosylation ligase (exosortase A-associated)
LIYIAYEINYLYVVNRYLAIWRRGYGGLDNNGAGLMLAMGIPLAIAAWEGTRRSWRWAYLAGVPLIVHAVLMSYSRGAMLALIGAMPFLVVRSRRRWQFAAAGALLALAVPVMAGNEIRQRFFSIDDYDVDASANSRMMSWKAAIGIANDNPVFGVGIRNSNLFSYEYGADRVGRTIHSQYFQILADSGYPALCLYLLSFAAFFWVTQRARGQLKRRDDPEASLVLSMITGVQGSMLVFAIGAVFLSLEVFELPYIVTLLGAQVAAIAARTPVPADEPVAGVANPLVRSGINPDWRPLPR